MNKVESQNSIYQEDEIDLRELFKTIWDKKVFIALFTLFITCISIIYVLTIKPVYEVKSNVQIGYIGETLILDPNTLAKTLNIVFNVEDKARSDKEFLSEVTSISTNKTLKNFIEIRTEAISNEEALKKNQEVVVFIKEQYEPKIKQFMLETENKIEDTKQAISKRDDFDVKNTQKQIAILKEQKIVKINQEIKFLKEIKLKTINQNIEYNTKKLNEYDSLINKLYDSIKNSQDTTALSASSIQMLNYQNLIQNAKNKIDDLNMEKEAILTQTIPSLQIEKENISNDEIKRLEYMLVAEFVYQKIKLNQEIDKLNYNISEQNIKNSELVGDFIVKDSPIKPKKRLIVTVAFVTGLILSIFIVFLLNFFREEKNKTLSA